MATEQLRCDVIMSLRDQAVDYPDVNEGSSCVKRAFKARTKGDDPVERLRCRHHDVPSQSDPWKRVLSSLSE